jgi:hypothetical protein
MTSNNLPSTGDTSGVANFLNANQVTPTTGGGLPFLKFDAKRTGQWLLGAESEECTDEVFSLDVPTLQHGYILWHQRKANRKLVPINRPLPEAQEPIHYTDSKGQPAVDEASEARSLEGTLSDGTRFLFEVSTFGGRKAVDALLGELFMRANQGSEYLLPQVKLESNSYDHTQYGLVYEPVLVAVAWFNGDGEQDPGDAVALDAPAPAPVQEEAAAPAQDAAEPEQTPADESDAPAPTRRRRRRAG